MALVRVEFIKATENRAVGDLMRVDKGSADALIGSGVARLADATPAPKRKPRKPVPEEAFAPTEPEPADEPVIGDDA
jgi:hypothetical protein